MKDLNILSCTGKQIVPDQVKASVKEKVGNLKKKLCEESFSNLKQIKENSLSSENKGVGGYPVQMVPSQPKSDPNRIEMLEDLNRRNLLEDQIIVLIGGKTGMIEIWRQIEECARTGDVAGFQMFSQTFPQKVERLKGYCKDLLDIKKKKQYQILAETDEVARRLTRPFAHSKRCTALIRNEKALRRSGLLDRDDITPEELTEWYRQFIMTGGNEDGN